MASTLNLLDNYQYDAFNDGSNAAKEELEKKIVEFAEKNENQLREIEEALAGSLSIVHDLDSDPINLNCQPQEQSTLFELSQTDNKLFSKLMLVFASLIKESTHLRETIFQQFIPPIALFAIEDEAEPIEGEAQIKISKMLPFFIDLSDLVDRSYVVIANTIQQLAALYHKNQPIYINSFKNIHLNTVFTVMGELLAALAALDEVIRQNTSLQASWQMYKKMILKIKVAPEKFNMNEDQIDKLEKQILFIDGQVLDDAILQNCIEQDFESTGIEVRSNQTLFNEFLTNFKAIVARIIGPKGELNRINQQYTLIVSNTLFVFFQKLFPNSLIFNDKKEIKAIWDLFRVAPIVHIYGNTFWNPTDFLLRKMPSLIKNRIGNDIPSVQNFLNESLNQKQRVFIDQVKLVQLKIEYWMVKMQSNNSNIEFRQLLDQRIILIVQGVILSFELSNVLKSFIGIHNVTNTPMKLGYIRYICLCAELLKAIQATFHYQNGLIAESIGFMIQHLSYALNIRLKPLNTKLEQSGKFNDSKIDTLSALQLAQQTLSGSGTKDRRIYLRLAMHAIFQLPFLSDTDVDEIRSLLHRLDILCDFTSMISNFCDCSFFYWHRILLPKYFKFLYENPEQVYRLPFLFAAIKDTLTFANKMKHYESEKLIESYKNEILQAFQENILQPLFLNVETELRLSIHANLNIAPQDPFKNPKKTLLPFMQVQQLRLFDEFIDIKARTAHYLDTTFYDHNTVALFDWRKYTEMRSLAQQKYGLEMIEVHLPGQTVEQGLDILEIMRNIHIFVSKYCYNLNNQFFIERNSESKHLNTISIEHIANSIRTHGIGIMNTTVNFAYQFLRKKFTIFSQFLFDDYIKSRLYRDIRYFKDNQEQINREYPYDRALQFIKDIRKLGVHTSGTSYLDQFRQLITEIGNTMGYVRLIRSGGLQFTATSVRFIPDIQEVPKFAKMLEDEQLPIETKLAAENLDNAIDSQLRNYAEGTEYFKMLVMVFENEFQSTQNGHLKNFYAILPPLFVNFIEFVMIEKDKLTKKGKDHGMFTDDGFAIGLAFILKVLDQYREFDALHWFDSVTHFFESKQQKVVVSLSNKNLRKEEQQTAQLTINKYKNYLRECELLRYSFSGARIFYKDT
eukprot:TRINITY_DN7156_c0_g1_i1.p1 TRINITY_DN7156_c0_g1~~TRINITY_DN7156_c0_g1_i1.p1  ORF type:complete len:1131 (+),score=465.04 TRINITY_DN7156_c0_g1_i1:117-3509(+)